MKKTTDRLYTYREIYENGREKQKEYSGVLCVTFFAFCAPFFRFLHFAPRLASVRKFEGFRVYFFTALIKHEIRLKCEKCVVSVLYFVVCFAETFAKYP